MSFSDKVWLLIMMLPDILNEVTKEYIIRECFSSKKNIRSTRLINNGLDEKHDGKISKQDMAGVV